MTLPFWRKLGKYESSPNDHNEGGVKVDPNNIPEAVRKAYEEAQQKYGDDTAQKNSTETKGAGDTNKQ